MRIHYKNKKTEKVLIGLNALAAAAVAASFVMLFGFHEPQLPAGILYSIQLGLLCFFIAEKIIRFFNAAFKIDFWRGNYYEVPFLLALTGALLTAYLKPDFFGKAEPSTILHLAVGIYLVIQVVIKVCRTTVNMAATGQSPTRTLIASFLVLIFCGTVLLMLPKSATGENISFVDAVFTSTSATCVTGLIVKDTGNDFSFMGQIIILSLIQLGGLGIVVFGVVFALLLGQALSLSERVAMQDLLSARTLNRIGNMIVFIFFGTFIIEALGTFSLFGMWDNSTQITNTQQQWFYSIFHSISAFCNAGFSLFGDSFVSYNKQTPVYLVICPLIILGGLGFGVLYDLANIITDKTKRFFRNRFSKNNSLLTQAPRRMRLQSKIVITVSTVLIIVGMLSILLFEHYTVKAENRPDFGVLDAFFQSVTARTAGFNTVKVAQMSPVGRFILIVLMFIGGSPGSTAGGIKTVTLAVIIMTVIAALRKRQEVELFKRSVRIVVVGRAITVTLLFVAVLFTATLALSITESQNGFDMSQISFEAASALGTVGLTTGITGSLTTAGKWIIIFTMLIGRLGPLTLLAALTFNLKPARFNYPQEAIIVG